MPTQIQGTSVPFSFADDLEGMQRLVMQGLGHERWVVLMFGQEGIPGFLLLWQRWRLSAAQGARLHVVVIAHKLPSVPAWGHLKDCPEAQALMDAWPPLTPNLQRLSFEQGRVQLYLAPGAVAEVLPELAMQVHAFCISSFEQLAPQAARLCKALARLSAPGAVLWCGRAQLEQDATSLKDLRTAGFSLDEVHPGTSASLWARYAPPFTPRRGPSRRWTAASDHPHALIVGAGLAGSACAWALAEQGWRSTVIDRHAGPAAQTSGNPAGLFHGVVHAQDGHHARFNRAAALEIQRVMRQLLQHQASAGCIDGLVRLEHGPPEVQAMHARLAKLKLPGDYVQACTPERTHELCGMALGRSAWFYPGGGWVRPASLVSWFLAQAGAQSTFLGQRLVHSLRRCKSHWQLLSEDQQVIAESEVVVLANAGDALRLVPHRIGPMQAVRGQLSWMPASQLHPAPSLPIAGAGYCLPEIDGMVIFGATSQPGETGLELRHQDHMDNLTQLSTLISRPLRGDTRQVQGRSGCRWVTQDRLPLIGAVPDADAPKRPSGPGGDRPRGIARVDGLHVFTALGSRGITWSALGAQVVAASIAGAPSPLENCLLDAIDPARFMVRRARLWPQR